MLSRKQCQFDIEKNCGPQDEFSIELVSHVGSITYAVSRSLSIADGSVQYFAIRKMGENIDYCYIDSGDFKMIEGLEFSINYYFVGLNE